MKMSVHIMNTMTIIEDATPYQKHYNCCLVNWKLWIEISMYFEQL